MKRMKYHHLGIPGNKQREGVRVAFIEHDGLPIEFLEYAHKPG
jgi:hypothetical protein